MQNYFKKKTTGAAAVTIAVFLLAFLTLILSKTEIAEKTESYETLEQALRENIAMRQGMVEINGAASVFTLQSQINDFQSIKSKDGFLYSPGFYIAPDEQLFSYAKRLYRLNAAAEQSGAKLLYVNAPEKDFVYEKSFLDPPVRSFENIQNEFLFYLSNTRTPYLDLRQGLSKDNIDPSKLFYKTDKAMTTYGSFQEFCLIIDAIQEKYGTVLDSQGKLTNENSYTIQTFSQSYLGDMGNALGVAFSGLDDFETYVRKDAVSICYQYIDNEEEEHTVYGLDNNVLLFQEELPPEGTYGTGVLDFYLNNNNPYERIINLDNPTAPKLLIIHDDSFSPVTYFLTPLFSEIHTAMSHTGAVDIEDYIEENTFDFILVCNSASRIREDSFDYYVYENSAEVKS